MFLRNMWYVAAFSADVQPGKCLGRRFLNEPVVLFRTASGALSALTDRCSHRAMPLSEGHVDGEIIRCPYHGLEFNGAGACARIPGQERIPPAANLRAYPVCERDELIWIWMGEPEKADVGLIMGNPEHRDPGWSWRPYYMHVHSNWQLLVDNILDLTHVAYIHANTIGGNPQAHFSADVSVQFDAEKVTLLRKMPNSVPPKTYVAAGGFKGNVDRWQMVEYQPGNGNVLRVNAGACDVGTGAYEGRRDNGFVLLNVHGVTPETETTTHYIWTICTNAPRESGVPDALFDQFYETIREDERALEAQQRRINDMPDMRFVGIASDGAVNRARMLLDRLRESEAALAS
ncbi:aromatic ring-hydroxylating dioxygenase subunit alpha [Variovorax sp. HW608]|uniref:aromatic ring-hydroxylating dioxygenase subunit alpha n=1 Tax=Variovorax sp. HW608 TaxID=1034889 RepID=UPI000B5B056C|nr:aromatic ring-hydroxylating dioxygenase subunit alpha [Variovorax sp. HW608]